MSTINFNFFRFSWKFIFIGQFFILICNFRIIFIVVYCVVFYNKTLRCMALRRSHFQCGNMQGEGHLRVPQPEGPPPAPPPSWARKEFCVVVCAALLTFVCMMRYSEWNFVPIWFLYSSVLMAIRYADLQSGSGILRYLWWYAVPICDLVLGFFGTYGGSLCRSAIWFWDSSVLMVVCCADLVLDSSIFMMVRCDDLRSGSGILRYL